MKEEVEDDEERPWRQYLEEILNLDLEDELLDEDDTENFEEWIEKAKDAFETRWNLVNTLLSRKETGSDD